MLIIVDGSLETCKDSHAARVLKHLPFYLFYPFLTSSLAHLLSIYCNYTELCVTFHVATCVSTEKRKQPHF